MSVTLWLPDTALPNYECQVPGCEAKFFDRDKYLRHVPRCARKNRGAITECSEERAAEIDADPFQRVWDPEMLEFVQRRLRR